VNRAVGKEKFVENVMLHKHNTNMVMRNLMVIMVMMMMVMEMAVKNSLFNVLLTVHQ
jgi:hypothetical protein